MMVGKITTVLIKKEAEAYRAQGLHMEAIGLYDKLIASSPNINPTLKNAIKSQIDSISKEMKRFTDQREQSLSMNEIVRIKEGWGDDASEMDIIVCAQALCQVGAYQDALEEFKKLLRGGTPQKKLCGAITDCLTQLYESQQLPKAVHELAENIYQQEKKALKLQLLVAKTLANRADKTRAIACYRYLHAHANLPEKLKLRIQDVLAKYETCLVKKEEEQISSDRQQLHQSPCHTHSNRLSRLFKSLFRDKSL